MDKSFARKYSDAFLDITKLAARMGLPGSEVAKGVIEQRWPKESLKSRRV